MTIYATKAALLAAARALTAAVNDTSSDGWKLASLGPPPVIIGSSSNAIKATLGDATIFASEALAIAALPAGSLSVGDIVTIAEPNKPTVSYQIKAAGDGSYAGATKTPLVPQTISAVRDATVSGPIDLKDGTILANAAAGNVLLTLPPAVSTSDGVSPIITVKRSDSSGNTMIVAASAGNTVEEVGSFPSSFAANTQIPHGASVSFICDKTNSRWTIV